MRKRFALYPLLLFVNYDDADHSGHLAKDLSDYRAEIRNCDEQMLALWHALQADPYHRDTTTVHLTNGHRHHTNDLPPGWSPWSCRSDSGRPSPPGRWLRRPSGSQRRLRSGLSRCSAPRTSGTYAAC